MSFWAKDLHDPHMKHDFKETQTISFNCGGENTDMSFILRFFEVKKK